MKNSDPNIYELLLMTSGSILLKEGNHECFNDLRFISKLFNQPKILCG